MMKDNPTCNFQKFIELLEDAEKKLIDNSLKDPKDRIRILRGLYYGTPWSKDYKVEKSRVRNLAFTILTGSFYDPLNGNDILEIFGKKLFQDLQNCQDVYYDTKKIDIGHVLIGLETRLSYVTRTINIPFLRCTPLEIVTWLGDLGGGAAYLAYKRSKNPNTNVRVVFDNKKSDYGASINLEGDVCAYVISSAKGVLSEPNLPRGSKESPALPNLFSQYLENQWDKRCKYFLEMIDGEISPANTNVKNKEDLIIKVRDKIKAFATLYFVQRFVLPKAQEMKKDTVESCRHLEGASLEVAKVFIEALIRSLRDGTKPIAGNSPYPPPTPPEKRCNIELLLEAAEHLEDLTPILKELYDLYINARKAFDLLITPIDVMYFPGDIVEGKVTPKDIQYEVDSNQKYGPFWKNERPPGLPQNARLTSKAGEALPYIDIFAQKQGLGNTFVRVVTHLAQTESGGRFGRPANNFDARPLGQRPVGKKLITAWGVFQFNRGAWRSVVREFGSRYGISKKQADEMMPWDASARQEIEIPILQYAKKYSDIINAGGSDLDAARGIRLWHRSPAAYETYFETGKQKGFDQAWQEVDQKHRSKIDEHLRKAGILK